MALFDFLTSGGSSDTSGTTTQEAQPRDVDQDRLWDEFMVGIFGPEEIRKSKQQEIDDLTREINSGSGLDALARKVALIPQLESLQKELSSLPETGKTLLERMEQDASAKALSDLTLGATAGQESQKYIDALTSGVDVFKEANKLYGQTAGDVGQEYIRGLTADTEAYNRNIDPLINSLRGTATGAPVNLSFGDFQTPLYTGSQRYAQNQFGGLSADQLDANRFLTGETRDTGMTQAELLNTLTGRDVGAGNALAQSTLNQNLNTANLLNEIATSNLPNTAYQNYLNFLGGQANLGEKLRYSLPTVSTTGSTETDIGPLGGLGAVTGIVGGVSDIIKPFL